MPRNNALLLFDLDGTMLDSAGEGFRRLLEIVKTRNIPLNDEIIKNIKLHWYKNGLEVIKTIWPDVDALEIAKEWVAKDFENIHKLVPRTEEALMTLKKFFYIGVLTNRSLRSTMRQLEQIDGIFNFVYSAPREFIKPHPKSMDEVLEKCQELGITYIVYVGDAAQIDYELTKNVGIEFLAVLTGVGKKEDFINAGLSEHRILNSIYDLLYYYETDKLTTGI